jgi:hypothetical protein
VSGYGFNEDGVRRIVAAVRTVEGASPRPKINRPSAGNLQFVRIIGRKIYDATSYESGSYYSGGDAGFWPGQVEVWDTDLDGFDVLGLVWVQDANDDALAVGRVYLGLESGDQVLNGDTRPLFVVVNPGAGLADAEGDGDDTASGSGGDACAAAGGLSAYDLFGCDENGMTQVADGCLRIVNASGQQAALFLALVDPLTNDIIAGGPPE